MHTRFLRYDKRICLQRAAQAGDATASAVAEEYSAAQSSATPAVGAGALGAEALDAQVLDAQALAAQASPGLTATGGATEEDVCDTTLTDQGKADDQDKCAAGDLDSYTKEELKQMIIEKDAEVISLQNALAVKKLNTFV